MTNPSNARFLGNIISEPLQIVGYYKESDPEENADGDAPEPDAEELPDMDWVAQKTEYEL